MPDPTIQEPTDAIVRITSSGLCGSDLHLYEVMAPFMTEGDILGHEPMGVVEAVGSAVTHIAPGDRVVIPFNISCGSCAMCGRGLQSQCETTQVREYDKGAALFGYTKLYGAGARAGRPSSCVCRRRSTGRSRCRTGRSTTGSCTCPMSCRRRGRRCEYADVPRGAVGRGARLGSDRVDGVSDRHPSRRGLGDRCGPCARAARTSAARTAPTCSTSASSTRTSS